MRGGLSEKVVSPSESRPPATLAELSCQRRSFERVRLTGGDFCVLGEGGGGVCTHVPSEPKTPGRTDSGREVGRTPPARVTAKVYRSAPSTFTASLGLPLASITLTVGRGRSDTQT